jgi:hypothetical protein
VRGLLESLCAIHSTGEILTDVKENIITPIPKKKRREDFGSCLTTHSSKVLTHIFYWRTIRRWKNDQCDFWSSRGAREAISALKRFLEKTIQKE